MFLVRYPFLAPGKEWSEEKIVTSPYSGDWTVGARKYRKWARLLVHRSENSAACPELRRMQRIILHHQYGEYFFPYSKLEQAYDDAAKAGIRTLFLFGWTAEGMDSGYPVYTPDPSQAEWTRSRRTSGRFRQKAGKSSSTSTASSSTRIPTTIAPAKASASPSNAPTAPNTANSTTSATREPFCAPSATRHSSSPVPPAVPGSKF